MRKPFVRTVLLAWLAAGTMMALSAPPATADDQQKVSRSLGPSLKAAQEAMKSQDWATALAHVHEAQALPDRTPFDDFTINQFLANIALGQKDYTAATAAYEAMADSPALPPDQKALTLTNAALLASSVNHLANVIRYGEQLRAMGPLDPKVAAPLAVAYYNQGDAAKALEIAKSEADASTAAGQVPQQGVLDIIARTQIKQNDYTAAAKTLEVLVQNYGDANDWAELIDLAFSLKGIHDLEALDLYRLRIVTGATTSSDDYAIMAQVASTNLNYPVEAVAMIEQGMAKGSVHPGDKASALLPAARAKAAKDKATIAEFDKLAQQHKTGDYDFKLAETYYGYGRYADAEAAARRAAAKGGTGDALQTQLVLGMSLVNQGKNADAVDAFSHVTGNVIAEKIAHLWTLYAQRKYGVAAAH